MKFSSLKLFILSSIATLIVLFIACWLWTDFQLLEVANQMFWVGAITLVVGGSFFYPRNKYQGLSVSIMTTLKDEVPDNTESIKHKEKKKTKRMIQGFAIASPGIILIITSWLIFSKI